MNQPSHEIKLSESVALMPSVASVEATPLQTLTHHREAIAHDTCLEDVHRFFKDRQVDFIALVRNGRVTGICGRAHLAFMLGSRFGFALNARSPAHLAGVKHPLVYQDNVALREVLQSALSRHDDEFYEDIALVNEAHELIGLIPVEALVRLQSRLVNAVMEEMRQQHETLQQQNLELFQAGHAVRQAQALSTGLFASNAIGACLLSPAGRVETSNRRFCELLGTDSPFPVETALELLLPEAERSQWRELLLNLGRNTATSITRDCELELPTGMRRILHFSFGWVPETSQICVCVDDITQQREFERRMQSEEKQKLLDTLAGGVAHELNNKLTPVLGYAELLEQEATPPMMRFIDYIRQGVQESAGIIGQLLHLSKPAGIHWEPVDLREVVAEAALMLQFQVRERRAQLRLETGTELLCVNAEAAQLKQVIMNLALNALHAMEAVPTPELYLTAGREGDECYFTVQDKGSGIPPEIIGRIFDPFFTTKGPNQGTGLGLSICHSIARRHGGRIEVRSKPREGTCFTIWLPGLVSATTRLDAPTPAAITGSKIRCHHHQRVLVVEDDTVIRKFLMEAVRQLYGCGVDGAVDGLQALDWVDRHDYDLILSDIRMPVMTGPEFYLRLKDCHPMLATKLVFVSGNMAHDRLQDDIARWGTPMLAKPFTLERLALVCASYMEENMAGVA